MQVFYNNFCLSSIHESQLCWGPILSWCVYFESEV